MKCTAFEEKLSEYFDGLLDARDASRFRAHALQCRACRALMDEVKGTIRLCSQHDEVETPVTLEAALEAISIGHSVFGCNEFEALITEFLDGFVPAACYHRFEEHATICSGCSNLLTDVVYAVAACHSVHTFEEVEAPATLIEALVIIAPPVKQRLARRFRFQFITIAERLIPNPARSARWRLATSLSIALAILAFLFLGFSDDGTVAGIYRKANVKASEVYSEGTEMYAQTDRAIARLEKVGYRLGEAWDALGGEDKAEGDFKPAPSPESDSEKHVEPDRSN